MKKIVKRLLLLLILVGCACMLLASCSSDPPTPPPATDPDAGYLYRNGTDVKIILSTLESPTIDFSAVSTAIVNATGKMPTLANDSRSPSSHEIVFGKTARPVTQKALEFLNTLDLANADTGVWCVYAYGDSISVVWTSTLPPVIDAATAYLIENCLNKTELRLADGPIHYGTVDLLEYQKSLEAEKRNTELKRIEAQLGKDAADAMREYLSLFDDRFYIWLAGLYDPETGALYYSNSGRDHEGFLPDIESTTRGYSWVASSGMMENYGGDIKAGLPKWLQEKVVKWLQDMQSPENGFFYHPQWGKSVNVNRAARDLDNATSFLKKLGADILYDTTNGYKGTLGLPGAASALVSPLNTSTVSAISKVVAANSAFPEYLRDTAKFREYILGLDWAKNSYSSGHTLESQAYQIKAAGDQFVAVYKQTMDEIQESVQAKLRADGKPENGLWESNVKYNSVNGLMKIGSTYTRLGLKLNYAKEAFESALKMVELESADAEGKKATNIVDVYNPWCCLNQILENIRSFGDRSVHTALRSQLTERSAELIRITRRKVSIFQKPDGSYGYMSYGVPAKSQGALVAVDGTNEGDVNGGTIATKTVLSHMCGALGISVPQLYFASDLNVFLSIIENATPIDKKPLPTADGSFDADAVGTENPAALSSISMPGGTLEVIEDARGEGNVLKYVTTTGTNDSFNLAVTSVSGADCYVAEWEMNILESKKDTCVFQITMLNSYMLTVTTSAGGYTIGDSSSYSASGREDNTFRGTYAYNEWHKIRIEYYVGTSSTTHTKVFVDGNLVAETKNYFGKNSITPAEPNNTYSAIRWRSLQSADMTVLFDNLKAEMVKTEENP